VGSKQIDHLVFLDIETTALKGPNSRLDAIVEIAAAKVRLRDRVIVDRFDTLIKPWGDSDQVIRCNNCFAGYTRDCTGPIWNLGKYHLDAGHFAGVDWNQGMTQDHALGILGERFLIEGATIAGQNPRFDLDHIQRDFTALGWEWPKLDYHVPDLCSPALFLVMAGKVEGVSLRNVIPWAYADPNRKQAHRAAGDVSDAIQVFWAMFDYFTRGLNPIKPFSLDCVCSPCQPDDGIDPRCPVHGPRT
jgi:hypothetical protein